MVQSSALPKQMMQSREPPPPPPPPAPRCRGAPAWPRAPKRWGGAVRGIGRACGARATSNVWRMGGRVRARLGAALARYARELSGVGVTRGAATLREAGSGREHLEAARRPCRRASVALRTPLFPRANELVDDPTNTGDDLRADGFIHELVSPRDQRAASLAREGGRGRGQGTYGAWDG